VSTAIHDFGGEGPLLVFAHATGMHGWIWKPVVDHLLGRARCVTVDLRGHGDSPLPEGYDLNWEGFGRDVLKAVAALGDGDVIGVGHSLGGAAMLMAELEAPGTFRQLFLYEPAVHANADDVELGSPLLLAQDAMVQAASRRRASFPSRADALANFVSKAPMAQFQASVLGIYVEHGFTDREGDPENAVELKCLPETEARVYAESYNHDAAQRLPELRCPVVLATGDETDPIQRSAVNALAGQIGTTPVILHGVDHFGPMQQPKQFAAAIARHILDA
jgi:pimeloyl-ACP methyl ester carboxylesterase